jgi:hypothetical protein
MDVVEPSPKLVGRDVLSKCLAKHSYTLPWTFAKRSAVSSASNSTTARKTYTSLQKAIGIHLHKKMKKGHESISNTLDLPRQATTGWQNANVASKIMPQILTVDSWVLAAEGVAGDRPLEVIKEKNLNSLSDRELIKIWHYYGKEGGSNDVFQPF